MDKTDLIEKNFQRIRSLFIQMRNIGNFKITEPKSIEECVEIIEKRKNKIFSSKMRKNFFLPQFQDTLELIKDDRDFPNPTFRQLINSEDREEDQRKWMGLKQTRGIFFFDNEKIYLKAEKKQCVDFFGFNEDGKCLKIHIECEVHIEFTECNDNKTKLSPYCKNIRFEVEEITLRKLLIIFSHNRENEMRIITMNTHEIIRQLRNHIIIQAEQLEKKLAMANDALDELFIEEFLISESNVKN